MIKIITCVSLIQICALTASTFLAVYPGTDTLKMPEMPGLASSYPCVRSHVVGLHRKVLVVVEGLQGSYCPTAARDTYSAREREWEAKGESKADGTVATRV